MTAIPIELVLSLDALQGSVPDTVLAVLSQSPASQLFEGILAIAAVGLIVVMLAFLFQVRLMMSEVRSAATQIEAQAAPLIRRSQAIAENVEYIAAVVRTDLERLSRSVRRISEGLDEGAENLRERVEEFNALIEVVQGEAEEIFLSTASTVRGVRAGAERLVDGSPSPRRTDVEEDPPES